MSSLYHDPAVDEMRRNGARLVEECGGDVKRIAERLRREQKEGGRRIVSRGRVLPRLTSDEEQRDEDDKAKF